MAIYVSKGETSTGLDVSYDSMFILKGGTAKKTKLNDEGDMYVSNGGQAIETEINEYGHMFVSKGGTVKQTTVTPYGWMYVSSGGIASDTTVNYRGYMTVFKGGKAYNANVSSGYFILSGGTINGLTIEKGNGYVSSGGGTINDLTMSGGFISFYSGTINRATVDHGDIYCYSGGKLNSATFNGGYLIVSSNCTANKITLENSARMDVYQSKSKASGVTVKTGGSMYIGSGAVVSNITFLGGISDPSKDQYAGRLAAYGGTIKGLTIGSGTSVGLFTGCTATKVKWTPGDGVVNIWSASVSFTSKYSGVYLGSNGAFVSNTKELVSETLKLGASAYVAKGGVASGLEIASGGSVYVWNGGKAVQTKVGLGEDYNYSYLEVSSGGLASDVTIFEKGVLDIYGGKADGVTICSGGSLFISRGTASGIKIESGGGLDIYEGTATDVEWTPFEGKLNIWEGGQVTFANELTGVYIGTNGMLDEHTDEVEDRTIGQVEETGIRATANEEMYVMSGGKAERTAVGNNGSMYVFDGGSADSTTICDGGAMYVYNGGSAGDVTINGGELAVNGGTATDVTLNGYMYVAGGSASGVTVSSGYYGYIEEGGVLKSATLCSGYYREGGALHISSGAVASDITLEYGACLYVSKGAKVTNVTSSYGSYIEVEKGATVKKITAVVAESPDTDHDVKNGWADKRKKTINKHIMDSEATLITESTDSIILDEDPMSVGSHDNFVGYTDEIDFKKVHLNNTAKLSFDIYATDASKFTIWQWDGKKNKLVSLQASTLKLKEVEDIKSGAKSSSSSKYFFVETKNIILKSGDYYLSMESTNAAKGGNAYYNVILAEDSQFFGTPNNGDDTWKDLADDYDLGALSGSKDNIVRDWVGYDDAVDYRKFTVEGEKTNFSFHIQSSDLTKFTVWKYDAKKKKTVALQTTSIEDNYWGEYQYGTTTDQLQLDAGEYYFSMESTNAKKGGNADYKVSVIIGDKYKAALAMPETDTLGISDALSFGQYDADVLADASASALADLDDKSGWMNISMLA